MSDDKKRNEEEGNCSDSDPDRGSDSDPDRRSGSDPDRAGTGADNREQAGDSITKSDR